MLGVTVSPKNHPPLETVLTSTGIAIAAILLEWRGSGGTMIVASRALLLYLCCISLFLPKPVHSESTWDHIKEYGRILRDGLKMGAKEAGPLVERKARKLPAGIRWVRKSVLGRQGDSLADTIVFYVPGSKIVFQIAGEILSVVDVKDFPHILLEKIFIEIQKRKNKLLKRGEPYLDVFENEDNDYDSIVADAVEELAETLAKQIVDSIDDDTISSMDGNYLVAASTANELYKLSKFLDENEVIKHKTVQAITLSPKKERGLAHTVKASLRERLPASNEDLTMSNKTVLELMRRCTGMDASCSPDSTKDETPCLKLRKELNKSHGPHWIPLILTRIKNDLYDGRNTETLKKLSPAGKARLASAYFLRSHQIDQSRALASEVSKTPNLAKYFRHIPKQGHNRDFEEFPSAKKAVQKLREISQRWEKSPHPLLKVFASRLLPRHPLETIQWRLGKNKDGKLQMDVVNPVWSYSTKLALSFGGFKTEDGKTGKLKIPNPGIETLMWMLLWNHKDWYSAKQAPRESVAKILSDYENGNPKKHRPHYIKWFKDRLNNYSNEESAIWNAQRLFGEASVRQVKDKGNWDIRSAFREMIKQLPEKERAILERDMKIIAELSDPCPKEFEFDSPIAKNYARLRLDKNLKDIDASIAKRLSTNKKSEAFFSLLRDIQKNGDNVKGHSNALTALFRSVGLETEDVEKVIKELQMIPKATKDTLVKSIVDEQFMQAILAKAPKNPLLGDQGPALQKLWNNTKDREELLRLLHAVRNNPGFTMDNGVFKMHGKGELVSDYRRRLTELFQFASAKGLNLENLKEGLSKHHKLMKLEKHREKVIASILPLPWDLPIGKTLADVGKTLGSELDDLSTKIGALTKFLRQGAEQGLQLARQHMKQQVRKRFEDVLGDSKKLESPTVAKLKGMGPSKSDTPYNADQIQKLLETSLNLQEIRKLNDKLENYDIEALLKDPQKLSEVLADHRKALAKVQGTSLHAKVEDGKWESEFASKHGKSDLDALNRALSALKSHTDKTSEIEKQLSKLREQLESPKSNAVAIAKQVEALARKWMSAHSKKQKRLAEKTFIESQIAGLQKKQADEETRKLASNIEQKQKAHAALAKNRDDLKREVAGLRTKLAAEKDKAKDTCVCGKYTKQEGPYGYPTCRLYNPKTHYTFFTRKNNFSEPCESDCKMLRRRYSKYCPKAPDSTIAKKLEQEIKEKQDRLEADEGNLSSLKEEIAKLQDQKKHLDTSPKDPPKTPTTPTSPTSPTDVAKKEQDKRTTAELTAKVHEQNALKTKLESLNSDISRLKDRISKTQQRDNCTCGKYTEKVGIYGYPSCRLYNKTDGFQRIIRKNNFHESCAEDCRRLRRTYASKCSTLTTSGDAKGLKAELEHKEALRSKTKEKFDRLEKEINHLEGVVNKGAHKTTQAPQAKAPDKKKVDPPVPKRRKVTVSRKTFRPDYSDCHRYGNNVVGIANIEVEVPSNMKQVRLAVGKKPTRSFTKSKSRYFKRLQSPWLNKCKLFSYQLQLSWEDPSGQKQSSNFIIRVHGGSTTRIELDPNGIDLSIREPK